MRGSFASAVVIVALLLAAPAVARAAAPGATTGDAAPVRETEATLRGSIVANKEDTTVHFEYGTTDAYGLTTPPQTRGGGDGPKGVSARVTGLTPGTTYHFRVVATNASGTGLGADKTFTTAGTAPPPAAVPIASVGAGTSQTTVTYGQSLVIGGQATGQGAGGARIHVRQSPFPFNGPFADATAPVTADGTGRYSVAVVPLRTLRYQVVAGTTPEATSAPIEVSVHHAVTFAASHRRIRRGRSVRLHGHAWPAHDGLLVKIQRRLPDGNWRTVTRTALRPSKVAGRSVYGRRVPMRHARTYRVLVPGDGDHVETASRAVRVRVR